jgi:hypothetical protein
MVSRVPPNIQRFLPVIAIVFVLLFVLPAILKKHSSGPNAKTKTAQTLDAATLIDKGEVDYRAAHGKYTTHLADLVALRPKLADDLGIGIVALIDVGTDGQSYLAQITSEVLGLVRGRTGDKVSAKSCIVLKSGSGVACPAAQPAK